MASPPGTYIGTKGDKGMKTKDEALGQLLICLAPRLRQALGQVAWAEVNEIRIRKGQPLCLRSPAGNRYVSGDGQRVWDWRQAYCPGTEDISQTLELMSRYSLYAVQEEIRQGFFTLPGGYRVGLCGRAVLDGGRVRTLREIGGLCVRLCRAVPGCSRGILPYLDGTGGLPSVLIVSPPGLGKTTLLRDLLRHYSGLGYSMGLVDERSEVAGCYGGLPQLDVGPHTDVLDGCPKAWGMEMLLRSMGPQGIAVDELGGRADWAALEQAAHGGVGVLGTLHGGGVEDARKKQAAVGLCAPLFDRYVVLGWQGRRMARVYDGAGALLAAVPLSGPEEDPHA